MKTIIFWIRKGARKPKQVGLATAECSALAIHDFAKMALEKKGRLYIVDAPTAAHGRRIIASHRTGARQDIGTPGLVTVWDGDRVVAIGLNASRALAGAMEGHRNWDARLARDGRVRVADTRALGDRTDGIRPGLSDYFGTAK